jgi:hypothetical protein
MISDRPADARVDPRNVMVLVRPAADIDPVRLAGLTKARHRQTAGRRIVAGPRCRERREARRTASAARTPTIISPLRRNARHAHAEMIVPAAPGTRCAERSHLPEEKLMYRLPAQCRRGRLRRPERRTRQTPFVPSRRSRAQKGAGRALICARGSGMAAAKKPLVVITRRLPEASKRACAGVRRPPHLDDKPMSQIEAHRGRQGRRRALCRP